MLVQNQTVAQGIFTSLLVAATEKHWKTWILVIALIHYSMADLSEFSIVISLYNSNYARGYEPIYHFKIVILGYWT